MGASTTPQITKYGPIGYQIDKDAHRLDLDAKVLITSHNSRPGLGKTTLAIKMARALDPNGWSAEEKAFMNVYDYMRAYDDLPSGSVLILDEIEALADSRRANAAENVDLSQAWATKRYRNMITFATLPTTSMLDKRMIELSDYRINVMRRGVAKAFEVKIPDFPPFRPWQEPMDGVIEYRDLPNDDPDKELLDQMKVEFSKVDKTFYTQNEVDQKMSKLEKQLVQDVRNDWLKELYKKTPLGPKELGNLSNVDVTPQRVSAIVRDVEKEVSDDDGFRNTALSELYSRTDLTTTDLADMAGLSQSYVSRIVNTS